MTAPEIITKLNAQTPHFIHMLGGKAVAVDIAEKTCTFEFDVSTKFCHSVNVVQGGFVTSMLDASMSHAVFALGENIINVSSLEIKTTFLEPTLAGRLTAMGKIIKYTYKTSFMEGHLYNEDGTLLAIASSVAKLVREK